MPYWQVHFLNARHALTRDMPDLRRAVADAVALAQAHAILPDFDVVIRSGEGIPEWGVGGASPAPGVIELTVAPGRFDPEPVIRTILHELHHVLRWDGPGYGRSLGEALVSEGLAGHFVQQVMGGPPDPWDATPPTPNVARRAITEWARRDYDHALWFFGRGNLRKYAGYGLGHRLIADLLAADPDQTAVTLAHINADSLRPVMRRLAGAELAEEDLPDAEPEVTPDPIPDPSSDAVPEAEDTPPVAPPDDSPGPQPDVATTGPADPTAPDAAPPKDA